MLLLRFPRRCRGEHLQSLLRIIAIEDILRAFLGEHGNLGRKQRVQVISDSDTADIALRGSAKCLAGSSTDATCTSYHSCQTLERLWNGGQQLRLHLTGLLSCRAISI